MNNNNILQRYLKSIRANRKKYGKWLTTFISLALAVIVTTSAVLTLSGIAVTYDRADDVGIVQEPSEDPPALADSIPGETEDPQAILQAENAASMVGATVETAADENSLTAVSSNTPAEQSEATEAFPAVPEMAEAETAEPSPASPEEIPAPEAAEVSAHSTTSYAEQAEAAYTAPENENTPTPALYPAQSFEAITGDMTVTVSADEGAFPEGTYMVVTPVAAETVTREVEAAVAAEVTHVEAVDISFYNQNDEKIEPLIPIRVKMHSASLPAIEDPLVVHLKNDGDAEVVEKVAPEQLAREALEAEDATIAEIDDEELTEQLSEAAAALPADELQFNADNFSVYVITAKLENNLLATDGQTYRVSLTYTDEAQIPEGSTLQIEEITPENYQYDTYVAQTADALESAAGRISYAKFVDITILHDGEEVHPAAPVDVKFELLTQDALENENNPETLPSVVHFGGEEVEVIEAGTAVVETVDQTQEMVEVKFEAGGFSVYGVVYTVDFHWEVDGKTFDFSIPGGGFISFYNLVEVLGIEVNDTNTEEDEIQKLVDGVESITFSDPELVSVSKVEEDTTVGAIKERLGLECEYSAELTEEQIAEINTQTVGTGDWALISLKAFDTEEYMTVTMKTGEVFQINVTDDQENPLGLDGKSFAITVYKNNNNYYLSSDGNGISSTNQNCLKAISYVPNDWGTPTGSVWTFEWTGEGKKYLIHDNQNRYILIENDKVSLTDRETALASPITVVSREGKYSFVNEKNNQALNIYGSSGFGRWDYNESNTDFLMTLQNPSNLKKPGTISTADTSGLLQINLFDYGPENELDKEVRNNSNPYSGGINSGHTLKFFSYGKNVGNGVNDFTGAGNGPQTGIVADQLSGNYPVLASNTSESLAYLFGGESNNYVTSYTGLNHLFTKDENGYYHYNSDQNYAYLDGSNFKVYSKTFPEEGADEQYFGVGFFPFNDYDEYYNCIHGKDGFERWDPHSNGTNPKKNGHYNHHFGMSLKGNFIMPPGGQYNGKDVTFQFSGDDDMWVYVDGVLIMDIGGVHNPVHGEINFTTGEVTVHGAAQENFKEKYKRITGNDWDDSDFSNHDFRVFYMERGGMYSNLEVTFNLPLTPETETNNFQFDKISSENESLKLSGAEFSLFNDPACGDPFTLASVPVKATSDKNGVVSFKNIPHGTYYMKETVYPEGYQAKTPEEIFTVVVDASGGTITSSSGDSISQVTNKPKKIDVEVEKVWSNGIVPSGAEIEIVLGRYKLVEDPNAPGTATLVIKDSYTGLPSGSNYHVTYTITGPDGYSKTVTKSYTDSSKQIEESVEVPASVTGTQYTVTKRVQSISHYNINKQNQSANVTVAKNGTGQAEFDQSTFTRNAYRVRIYAVNSTDPNNLYSENYYPANSALTVHIEAGETWTWSNGYRFRCSSSTTSSTKDFSSNGTWNFTSSLKSDVDLVVTCTNNSGWNKSYSWIKDPYITGANPVQAASADRMMMTTRRGAPAQSMSQTASDPTLPEPPQNTLYVLDEEYAANPDKITLSGGTWTGKAEELDAYNEYGPYVYYIASVNESGMPEGTQITISNEVTMDEAAQVLTVTNTVPTGYLRIDKSVTFNGISPVPDDKKAALAGMYEFKVYTDENCSIPYKVKNGETESDLTLTVTIGNDGAAQSSGTVQLPVGDYWIEEQTPSQTGVTPDANRIHVVVTESSTASSPATAEFVNNKDESNDPDEQAIELEKKFSGITDASQIPSDFHVTLSYKVPGSVTPVTITLNSSTEGHVTCTKSNNDLTWHWRITHIPVNATDFSVSESNYDIDGYTRVTKINGTTVEDPSSPEGIVILQPEISMVNFWSDYTTSDKRKIFPVTGNQILLVRSTTGVTVVVSQKSLSMATRNAIEDLITNNGGKIPGDPDANAKWETTFVYFSHEIQGDRFSYGGRTIFFNGNNVEVPHNASSHEVRVDINYISKTVQNSFVLENNYTEIPITIDIEKVEKDDTSVKLPGAVFTLRKIKDADPINGTYATEDGTSPRDSEPTAATTGMTSFDNLTNGYYELTEKTAPAGYVLTDEMATYFKVESGVVTWLVKGDGKPSTWTTKSGKGSGELVDFEAAVAEDTEQGTAAKNAKFVIENEPGAALPHTGGPGTTLFYLIGLLLTAIACTGVLSRRRSQ